MGNNDNDYNEFEDFEDFDVEDEIITMVDDNGKEVEFVVVDACECDGVNYILVVESAYADDDEAEAEILKEVSVSDTESYYSIIDDEAEFEKAAKLFQGDNDNYDIEI